MAFTIDHVVIAVRDLAQASADYAAAGFTVVPGGEHADGATHNALIAFADGAYFELIAFKEPDLPQPHRWWPILQRGEGTVDFALLADDLATEVDHLRGAGLDAPEPREGGRLRPDGQRIGWRNLELGDPDVPLPFLIEDVTPRGLRVASGEAAVHPLGVSGVIGVTVLVADIDLAVARYAALLSTEGSEVNAGIEGVGGALRFPLAEGAGRTGQWIELAQPDNGATDLQRHLAERGAGPYRVVLAASRAAATPPLAAASSHGARIEFAG